MGKHRYQGPFENFEMPVRKKRFDGLTLNPVTLGPPVEIDSFNRQKSHMEWVVASGKFFKLRDYHYCYNYFFMLTISKEKREQGYKYLSLCFYDFSCLIVCQFFCLIVCQFLCLIVSVRDG